ncbi:MAG TPA: hypothetical protein VNO55_07445 [Polyangia bacterium]|nr:hypothetical protein [Polyangia bacterium]
MRRKRAGARVEKSGAVCITGGVDVGETSIKSVLLVHSLVGEEVVAANVTLVRGSREPADLRTALRCSWAAVLAAAGVSDIDVAYVASTGTRDQVAFRVGHFLGRNCLGLGTRFRFPQAVGYVDWGARQLRCGIIDDDGQVVRRVSRRGQVDAASAAVTVAALVGDQPPDSPLALIGGRTCDRAWQASFASEVRRLRPTVRFLVADDAIFAAAYGAAVVAARRYRRLSRRLVALHWVRPSEASPWLN